MRIPRAVYIVISILTGAGVVVAAVALIGRYTFERRTDQEIRELLDDVDDTQASVLTEADLEGLPDPVQRWLQYSGVIGRERPISVRLKQEGEIRLGPDQAWMPFTAEQYYTTTPPAFIWRIQTRMMSVIPISGQDMYRDGRGRMEIRLLSLLPVVNETGEHMDQGTLLRYLNETMWFPAGAVSPYINWEEVNDNTATATMRYGDVEATATFFFDDEGRMTNMTAQRYQDAGGGEFKLLPWWTPISDYGTFDGVRVPIAGEGVWEEQWGEFSYVRIRIIDLEYNNPEMY
jgi:hypothetical protein